MNKAAQALGRRGGRIGGKSTSEAKAAASRNNGTMGGRPRRRILTCSIAPETMAELSRRAAEQQSNLGRVIDALVSRSQTN